MNQPFWPLTCFFMLTLVALPSDAIALSRAKPAHHAGKVETAKPHPSARKASTREHGKHEHGKHVAHAAAARHKASKPAAKASVPPTPTPTLSGDLLAVKQAVDLARAGKGRDATVAEKAIGDPAARKLVEWVILRHPDSEAGFGRFATFLADNPDWPSAGSMRRRAEVRLWQERSDASIVHDFTREQPVSAMGRFALARVLLAEGRVEEAARRVREGWQSAELSERSEAEVFEQFKHLLSLDDHRARMDRRIGAKDFTGAMRAARHLGSEDIAIVKACAAVAGNATKAPDLLDGVAADARKDLGYTLCRIDWTMRHDRVAEATRLMLAAAPATMPLQDTDEWWRMRRVLVRKLIDGGEFRAAYKVARDAAPPANQNYRAEFHFMTGWVALRYLHDPETARAHFARIDDGSVNPIVLARANYWRGRAAEASGDLRGTLNSYQRAARYTTAYYGQLARAKLGLDRLELRTPQEADPMPASAGSEDLLHAAEMLYAIGERDLVLSFVTDLAEQSVDAAALTELAEMAGRHNDAPAMLQIGKLALSRGFALDLYAFPTIGVPQHSPIGPAIERSVIYSVARTESAFDQRDRSPANAVGLMQVTPEAGRDTAKRFGVTYDWDRMVADPVYNAQMGAAELSALLQEYRGSHILAFAAYNAGRGRVQQWIKQYGDPRAADVDAVDWVERIPFAETRNYVQRVMENLQVYRVRFDPDAAAVPEIEARHAEPELNSASALPPTSISER
jgi:soluble lytic murein transglycosylase